MLRPFCIVCFGFMLLQGVREGRTQPEKTRLPAAKMPTPEPPKTPGPKTDNTPLDRPALERRLTGTQAPATADAWQKLGTNTGPMLLIIARDPKAALALRARAIDGMAYFPLAANRDFLETTLIDLISAKNEADKMILRRAAVALGWQGAGNAATRIAVLLDHDDADVRADAALALGLTRNPAAIAALQKRSSLEKDPRVRRQLDRQIRVIESARGTARAKGDGTNGRPEGPQGARGPYDRNNRGLDPAAGTRGPGRERF